MKRYLLHLPTYDSMGSAYYTYFMDGSQLRRTIRHELRNRASGLRHCAWMTGTLGDEKFCDSADIAETVEDVIQKRMSRRTTPYAKTNDLVELPDGVHCEERRDALQNVIFLLCPLYVAVGSAQFIRYFVEFGEAAESLGLEKDSLYEFTSWSLQNVLEKSSPADYELEWAKHALDEPPPWFSRRRIRQARNVIRKFSRAHLNGQMLLNRVFAADRGLFKEELRGITMPDAYRYPALEHRTGVVYSNHRGGRFRLRSITGARFRCDELFRNGLNVECIPAIETGSGTMEDFAAIPAYRALFSVFWDGRFR